MSFIKKSITCLHNGNLNKVELKLTVSEKCILEVHIPFNNNFIVEADDFYECFRKLRELDKSIAYYCKGARLNVLPSRMTRQMTMGMSAYETTLGKPARKEDLVDIFDYEDQGLVSDPERQDEYQKEWFLSLKH